MKPIKAVLMMFLTLTLLLAAACALFGPQERADIVALAGQEREQWERKYAHGRVSKAQYDEAIARLDRILAAARDESTRDLLWDIGLIVAGGIASRGNQVAKTVVTTGKAVARRIRKRPVA